MRSDNEFNKLLTVSWEYHRCPTTDGSDDVRVAALRFAAAYVAESGGDPALLEKLARSWEGR